jgi:hypothetical protein
MRPILEVLSAPFRLVGRILHRIGRLISGRR